jgi:DNA-binding LytR/AlgR family response regulator
MNTLTGRVGHTASKLEGAGDLLTDQADRHLCAELLVAHDEEPQMVRSMETLFGSRAAGNAHSLRVGVKVKGKILFIDMNDVVAIHSKGNYLRLEQQVSSLLIRGSISMVAETLDGCGFIRINRSALMNASFVEEIRPLPTGEYRLRIKGGKEYTVTRTYRRNLRALAKFWIGTGVLFPARPG